MSGAASIGGGPFHVRGRTRRSSRERRVMAEQPGGGGSELEAHAQLHLPRRARGIRRDVVAARVLRLEEVRIRRRTKTAVVGRGGGAVVRRCRAARGREELDVVPV